MIKKLTTFILLTLFFSEAQGQDTMDFDYRTFEPNDPVLKYPSDWEVLKEVKLHSSRSSQTTYNTGMNVTVISNKELEQMPAQTINEVLAWTSSVDIRERGPMGVQSDIGVRGSGFDQALVMVDGIRMSDPQTGHHQMNLPVPLQMIERIEVIRGSAARRYGLNAMSGVINIITKKKPAKKVSVTAFGSTHIGEVDTTNNRYLNQGARIYLANQWSGWNVKASADYLGGEGYRYNSGFQSVRGLVSLSKQFSHQGELSFLAGNHNNHFGANDFYSPRFDENSTETVNTHFLNGNFTRAIGKNGLLTARASGRWNFDHYELGQFDYVNKHQSQVVSGELNFKQLMYYQHGVGEFTTGIETRQEKIASTNLGDRNRNIHGMFGEYRHSYKERLFLTAGAYGMYTESLGFKIYPGIEGRYRITNGWSVWGNWGTGQRLPTYTDLYYSDRENQSNPNLVSERSRNIELGLSYQKMGFTQRLSIFQKNQLDMIDWVRSSDTVKWTPFNTGMYIFQGIEGGLKYLVPRMNNWSAFIGWDFCLMDAERTQSNQTTQPSLSKYALNFIQTQSIQSFGLHYYFDQNTKSSINFRLQWQHIERSLNERINLFDLRLKYQRGNSWNVFLDLKNITNERYLIFDYGNGVGIPNLPRWVQAGVQFDM